MNIIKSITSVRSLALASLVCALATGPAWSNPLPSVTVHYADLDLSTTAGATTLYHRIRGAAKGVCGTAGTSLVEIADWQNCVDTAVGDAIAAVHSPVLTALYTGKRPAPVTAMLNK